MDMDKAPPKRKRANTPARKAANKRYDARSYVQFTAHIKPPLMLDIEELLVAAEPHLSKPAFLGRAVSMMQTVNECAAAANMGSEECMAVMTQLFRREYGIGQ